MNLIKIIWIQPAHFRCAALWFTTTGAVSVQFYAVFNFCLYWQKTVFVILAISSLSLGMQSHFRCYYKHEQLDPHYWERHMQCIFSFCSPVHLCYNVSVKYKLYFFGRHIGECQLFVFSHLSASITVLAE